eukprot:6489937-Amphidinium_carterae.2
MGRVSGALYHDASGSTRTEFCTVLEHAALYLVCEIPMVLCAMLGTLSIKEIMDFMENDADLVVLEEEHEKMRAMLTQLQEVQDPYQHSAHR